MTGKMTIPVEGLNQIVTPRLELLLYNFIHSFHSYIRYYYSSDLEIT